jgi:hypothetical protein
VVTEPLPSYQQFFIVGFRGYESCTRYLATAKLKHIYFLKYFGPLGIMPPGVARVFITFHFITSAINCCRRSVVMELLHSYQQFFIVRFRGYESWTRCLATARPKHTYFLKYFGPLGRMSHFSLLILFLILIQSGKRRKWNLIIHRKIVMPEHTHMRTYIHFYIQGVSRL